MKRIITAIIQLLKETKMKRIITIIILLLVAFFLGLFLGGGGSETPITEEIHDHSATQNQSEIWTCSMHPQIRMPEPGQCPICGMDLILASSGDDEETRERELKFSSTAIKLADIQTAVVERSFIPVEIRLVGKMDYDETSVNNITAWVPGRIDQLFVDYTGITVKKGDHMASLYSPELLTAQEELIQAIRSVKEFKNSSMKSMRDTAQETLTATREKLRLWGLTKEQVDGIEKRGKAIDHMTIYSPMSGIVVKKNVEEGAYVKTGTKLYTVADMSRLWVKLDAYESDLVWLRYGQEVNIETEAYPGEIFKGTISFIDPVLDTKTQTVKVRVNVPNKNEKLKPGMFVRSVIHARVAQSGKVMDQALAGKWICPMHPEEVEDRKGSCDICGMPLVTAESLGYATVNDMSKETAPFVIPASAPLITGKRVVVYIAHPDKEGIFEGREITLGPRVGDHYIVNNGLHEGDKVVTNGNFKIDSALQIQAKPSMMSPDGGVAQSGHANHGDMTAQAKTTKQGTTRDREAEEQMKETKITAAIKKVEVPTLFRDQIDTVLTAYFTIQSDLSRDDSLEVQKHGGMLLKGLDKVDMALLKGPEHMIWMKDLAVLDKQGNAIKGTIDIKVQREAFHLMTETLKSVIKRFGTGGTHTITQFHCPMAFGGKGADWLQNNKELRNPYFGEMMLKCGEETDTLVTAKD